MHPSACLHMAADSNKRQKTSGKNRGGVHLRAAGKIDAMFESGAFDLPAFLDWAAEQSYCTPVNEVRNAFAKSVVEGSDDAVEASLYSDEGFCYLIWNRKIGVVSEMRASIFASFAAANEGGSDEAVEVAQ